MTLHRSNLDTNHALIAQSFQNSHENDAHDKDTHKNNTCEQAFQDVSATLEAASTLSAHVKKSVQQYFTELEGQLPTNLYQTFLQEIEKPLLEVVLEKTHGNQSKASKILGLNRGTLRKKMQIYDMM